MKTGVVVSKRFVILRKFFELVVSGESAVDNNEVEN